MVLQVGIMLSGRNAAAMLVQQYSAGGQGLWIWLSVQVCDDACTRQFSPCLLLLLLMLLLLMLLL
jgi:hypothetical protein